MPNWSDRSNTAFAMGYDILLYIPDSEVVLGDEMKILYRAPGEQLVSILLFRYGMFCCDPTHVFVQEVLVPGARQAEGVYEIDYDFLSSQTGKYLDRTTYYVVMCLDLELETYKPVYFNDP